MRFRSCSRIAERLGGAESTTGSPIHSLLIRVDYNFLSSCGPESVQRLQVRTLQQGVQGGPIVLACLMHPYVSTCRLAWLTGPAGTVTSL